MTDANILEHVARLPHARATFKQLVRELGSKLASRDELESALDRLIERGQLVEVRSGHFVVTRFSREYAVGRLNMHRDGYGFLIPDHPIEGLKGDVYIPRESAQAAMHGDRVVVRIARIERDGRADGEIVKVLRRAHQTVVGEFRIRKRGNFVAPHDERIRQWIRDSGRHGAALGRAQPRPRGRRAGGGEVARRSGRHDRQRRDSRVSRRRRAARWDA